MQWICTYLLQSTNSALSKAKIEDLCNDLARLLGLWDGALSQLHANEPTEDDYKKAQSYIDKALALMRKLNMNVTVKGHRAECHLVHQIGTVPGGLFEFNESWGEQAHQLGYNSDMRLRNQGGEDQKAKVRAANARRECKPQMQQALRQVKE
ncbi:LOW QUALITY PROTEIN: hypothetical protein ACHAWF_001314 [Thalassiosira exigua]